VWPAAVATAAAFVGMWVGQMARARLSPLAFRRWFLIAMLLLGVYLAGETLARM
jgi:uncharacterized membrane protein YfcA